MINKQFHNLDWALLWQQAKAKKNWRKKGAVDWDKKAASFAKRTAHSVYTEKFLALLAPQASWSVLDIGCGPGTLSLPIAALTHRVTALDFSGKMLDILKQRAKERHLANINCRQLSWQDDWHKHGITPHEVAIASRSLAVPDLKQALEKLCTFATKKICITDRVKDGPMDPDAFAAVGRKLESGPDFIYTVNLLYQMGYLPEVTYIPLEESLPYESFEDALASYTWMFHRLTPDETKSLTSYVQSIARINDDGTVQVHRKHIPTWAFISWSPADK